MEILYREGELEEVPGAGEQEEGVSLTERQSIPDDGGQLGPVAPLSQEGHREAVEEQLEHPH